MTSCARSRRRCSAVAGVQDKAAWLLCRRNFITASEVSVVLEKNPYKTRQQLFYEKLHGAREVVNEHTLRGQREEPRIIQKFSEKHGCRIRGKLPLYKSDKYPWLAATPDAVARMDGGSCVVEVKCPVRPWSKVPEHYVWQVRTQMLVLGLDKGLLVAASPPWYQLREFQIELTSEHEKIIVEKTKQFHAYVQMKALPIEFF